MSASLTIAVPRNWRKHLHGGLLHAMGLVRCALLEVCAGFESGSNPRAQMVATIQRQAELIALREEELRIVRSRMACIPPRRRPYYPPAERLAILLLRAKAGWNTTDTATRMQVTAATITGWTRRVDSGGTRALIQTRSPVNRFPDFVAELVRQFKALAPRMGRRKLADMLARAGLHLAASTAERMLKAKPPRHPAPAATMKPTRKARKPSAILPPPVVTAKSPNQLWHVDITLVPTVLGFWVPWWPFSAPTPLGVMLARCL